MDDRVKEFKETYEVRGKVGKGGGGTVFKAYHKRLKKEVVLKKIHSNLKNINARAETDILKKLKHEYLPQVLDFLEVGGNTFTVMDYIEGESLKECLDEKRVFTQAEVIVWFRQLCEALEVLHTQNPPIIHGDIKPANIMLTPSGNICLIDFNIASIFEGKNTTISGYTPGYAAPEQIRYYKQIQKRNQKTLQAGADGGGEKDVSLSKDTLPGERTEVLARPETKGDIFGTQEETELLRTDHAEKPWENWREDAFRATVDVRTDIFSLGASVYHLLTGEKPRQGKEKIRDIRELMPEINEPLACIIMKCIAEEPEDRYQNVQELSRALQNVYTSTDRYQKLLRRQRMARVLLCVLMMAFLGVAHAGRMRLIQERDTAYLELVKKENEAAEKKDWELLEEYCSKAREVSPERAEAYQIKAEALYHSGKYEEALRFLCETAIPYVEDGSGLANLETLVGSCYFALGDYEQAKQALEQALEQDPENVAAYRDYAVTMARLDNAVEAEKILEQAVVCGLADDGIHYTEGEIAYAKGDLLTAEQEFAEAVVVADDDYMRLRAYLMQANIKAEQEQTVESCTERISILEQAHQNLPGQYLNAVLEQLAQAYIDLADVGGEAEARLNAIRVMREIESYQWDTYTTHQNIVILYERNGMYGEALEELSRMLDLYGEDYRTYKYLALVEAAKQNTSVKEERDYAGFQTYYKQAAELYQQQKPENQTDADMETLERLYAEACQGGWL